MITTLPIRLNMRLKQPRSLHAIPTRPAGWRAPHIAGLVAATMAGAALLGAALGGHMPARADHGVAAGPAGPASKAVGAIDHSVLDNPALLPEPNAALLHSDPNAYVKLNADGRP